MCFRSLFYKKVVLPSYSNTFIQILFYSKILNDLGNKIINHGESHT